MNLYCVSTGCYSGYSYVMLKHKVKFRVGEFNRIVDTALKSGKVKDMSLYSDCVEIAELLVKEQGFEYAQYIECHAYDYGYDNEEPKSRTVNRCNQND